MECLTEEDRRTKKDIDSPQTFEANKNNSMNRGRGMVFGLGKQTVNGFFENENFELILFSEFQNFGEANASPVPRPLN